MLRFSPILLALILFTIGCTKKSSENQTPSAKQVNLAIWGNYLAPEQEKLFKEKTGIKLNVTNYASNEELLAKLQAGATGYDVAVPSDYMVAIMIKMGLLEKVDRSKLSNFSELNPLFLDQAFDPKNEHSIPYTWTLSGIAVHQDLVKTPVKGWKDLFELKELNGKVSLLDDAREALGAALKSKGYSYNTTNTEELKKAKELLLSSRSRIKMFRSDMVDPMINKEIAAGQIYSSDANQAWKKSGGKVQFVVPEEGTTFAIDNLVILKGAKNVAEAHALIDFFLQPEVNKIFVEKILSGPVLTKTVATLSEELKKNPSINPSAKLFSKMEKLTDLGETTRSYDEAWTEVKSK